tara:strand:- start:33 stop:230 length:198 start_codon:yes stop_codon:yes gene_type:complete
MSKMGWLHHLVQITHNNKEERKELEQYLGESCNFANPKLAADEFLKAYADLERDANKVKELFKDE